MDKVKAIIQSLWKSGHTELAIEYAKEWEISKGDFMELIQVGKVEPSRNFKGELEHAVRFPDHYVAIDFMENNLQNYIAIVEDPDNVLIVPEAYHEEAMKLGYTGYKRSAVNWMKF